MERERERERERKKERKIALSMLLYCVLSNNFCDNCSLRIATLWTLHIFSIGISFFLTTTDKFVQTKNRKQSNAEITE